MKTNVIMTRKMGQFQVEQRTIDEMFNASALLEQWNKSNPKELRRLDHFWNSTRLKELMTEIAENELNFKSPDFGELKTALTDIRRGRHNSGTWMHPYLFIKFAMYISPKFEYSVIKFVFDELVKNRHIAGDKYTKLSAVVSKFPNVEYHKVGIALNYIVFNRHEKNIRNTATQEQLQQMHELEDKLVFAVDMGLITNYTSLMDTMRKMWRDKHCKF